MPPRSLALTCPSPPQATDCPLYAQRLDYGADEPLRRAILTERRRPDLADLIRAEALTKGRAVPALPPASEPDPLPIIDHVKQKGTTP
jgi:hypothetical protein